MKTETTDARLKRSKDGEVESRRDDGEERKRQDDKRNRREE